MNDSNQNIALITGASRLNGIGAAVALTLAKTGFDICTTYFRPYDHQTKLAADTNEPQILFEKLQQTGRRITSLEIDLSDPQSPHSLFEYAENNLGPINVLVNNATHSMRDGIENLTAAELDKHYAVNVRGMALLCAEFVRRYKTRHAKHAYGRIINLSSGQSAGPMPGELAYVATKGAVEAFTTSLSAEVASLGITVNAIDPGITDTGWIPPELHTQWTAESPMGRVGQPTDVANLIQFLASAESGWITGQLIRSRGGL